MQKIRHILKQIDAAKASLEFFPTGFTGLDYDIDGGFMRKELIVIGGFTGIGKSYIAGQIFFNIARAGFNTAYFSLEISNAMLVSRLLGQEADIKSIKIVTGKLTDAEKNRKVNAEGRIHAYDDYMSFYDNTYEYDEIEKQIRECKYDLVVIDFVQNIIVKSLDEYARLSYIALRLQKLAKEMNCCVLILSQLSNEVARNVENSNLEYKGSGAIATVCDMGFIITRDFQLNTLQLFLRKNRRGASGLTWQLRFAGEGGKII